MKKILVLGGSGFLGSHVADALTDQGFKVTIADKKKSKWINRNQTFKICDIKNNNSLNKLTKGMHAVFNFAAIADLETSLDSPIETVETNILPVVNLLKICKKNNVKRFIQASTVYVGGAYGSFYKSSKLACESYIEEFNKRYNLDYSILRYGTIYGPRSEKTNSVYQIVQNALIKKSIEYGGNPEIVRDYIHVFDAAKASVKSLGNDFKNKKIIISGNQTIKVKDLLKIVTEILNINKKIKYVKKNKVRLFSHYTSTPYSMEQTLVMKYNSKMNIDIGQGLMHLIKDFKKDNFK
tara:strand:- start:2618 stop:3502 length:885 start_codon:yes stop_codon:yes gene_type:complete